MKSINMSNHTDLVEGIQKEKTLVQTAQKMLMEDQPAYVVNSILDAAIDQASENAIAATLLEPDNNKPKPPVEDCKHGADYWQARHDLGCR